MRNVILFIHNLLKKYTIQRNIAIISHKLYLFMCPKIFSKIQITYRILGISTRCVFFIDFEALCTSKYNGT